MNVGARPRAALPVAAMLAALAAVASVVAGVVLRLWGLADQVLGGDELHAVRVALAQPLSAVLTTYQLADACIPLTALDRWLLDHGVALSEMWLRLPVLTCGLAALAAIPALARRYLEPAARPILWALVATSPLLVLYSRIARSYMPATLLSFAAVMAFGRWWMDAGANTASPADAASAASAADAAAAGARGSRVALACYAALGALAVWFHLGTAPIVAAPLVVAASQMSLAALRGWRSEGGRLAPGRPSRWRELAAAAAGLASGWALFLVPAAPSLARLVAAKSQAQRIPAAVWGDVLRLQAGCGGRLPAALFWLSAAVGAVTLVRRWQRCGIYLVALALAQVLGIRVLSPLGLARAQVLDRYLLPVLPIVLVWVATGLARPWWPRQSAFGRRGQRWAAAGLLLVWVSAGPFGDADFRSSSFMHHNDMVAFALPRAVAPPGAVPRPYLALGGPPGTAVIELPWPPVWDFGRSFYVYQEVHGLRVLVAAPGGALLAGRLRWRNQVEAAPAALLGSGARYVVVHRHLAVEENRLTLPAGPPAPRHMPAAAAAALAAAGNAADSLLASAWGPPAYADADVAVWDLAKLRRGGAGGAPLNGR